MIDNRLTDKQIEVIGKQIEQQVIHLFETNPIISFLEEQNYLEDLEDDINYTFRQALKFGKFGIRSHNIDSNEKICVIGTFLNIDKRLVDAWLSNGHNEDTFVVNPISLKSISEFSNRIERFILRGIDIIDEFEPNELEENVNFDSFFGDVTNTEPIYLNNWKELILEVGNLTTRLQRTGYFPPFMLMSDSKTRLLADNKESGGYTPEGNIISIKDRIERNNDIENWIDFFNVDNENDHILVCIPKYRKFQKTFVLKQKKPLKVSPITGGFELYWCGGLKVFDKNAIQRIKITFTCS